MVLRTTLNIALAVTIGLLLVACAGSATKKEEAPATEQGAPAGGAPGGPETGGAGGGGVSGQPLGGGAQMGAAGEKPGKMTVYFAFDSSAIDAQARATVEAQANYLVAHPEIKVKLEGNTDERGTREYNLALGERRADSVERMLRVLGVNADRITTVSYGEEHPVAMGHDESAWRLNRRVDFAYLN